MTRYTVRELRTYTKARDRRVWSVIVRVAAEIDGCRLVDGLRRDSEYAGREFAVFEGRRRIKYDLGQDPVLDEIAIATLRAELRANQVLEDDDG